MTKEVKHYIVIFLLIFVLIIPFLFAVDISGIFLQYMSADYTVISLVYICALILSVVVAPFTMPLFLISGGIFGPLVATVYNIIGWSVGAVIAFLLARFFGKPILSKFVSLKKVDEYEKKIPKKLEFWSVVLLRVIIPVDLLSYALGFFSNISFARYTIATIIGITPFAAVFAYGGSALFDGKYFVVGVLTVAVLLVFCAGYYILKNR